LYLNPCGMQRSITELMLRPTDALVLDYYMLANTRLQAAVRPGR
jgi:hypothetical protein